jgi:hypothetical protein
MRSIIPSRLPLVLVVAACLFLSVASSSAAAAQQNAAPASTAPSIALKPYTAPDNSASAGVPSGWTVSSGSQTVIQMTGPQGAEIVLGKTFIARNAAFQAGQRGTGGADLSMPYSANLEQKLTMIFQQGAALGGLPAPQITFASATPIQLPPALGQCGRFVANLSTQQGPAMLMGVFCSLPLDSAGIFKNILIEAQAPASIAPQDAPIASAVFASYKIPVAMLQKKVAPFTAPPMPAGGVGTAGILPGLEASDTFADCFDESVIRQYGPNQLPQECGGRLPNP